MSVRVRRPAGVVAGEREAMALAGTLGGDVRGARRSKRLTLEELGRMIGLSRSRLAEIERGEGRGTPLGTWNALGIALGRPGVRPGAVAIPHECDDRPTRGRA